MVDDNLGLRRNICRWKNWTGFWTRIWCCTFYWVNRQIWQQYSTTMNRKHKLTVFRLHIFNICIEIDCWLVLYQRFYSPTEAKQKLRRVVHDKSSFNIVKLQAKTNLISEIISLNSLHENSKRFCSPGAILLYVHTSSYSLLFFLTE